MNVFTNSVAALHNEEKPVITICLSHISAAGVLRIEIIDNGVGVPKNLQDRVLEPYVSSKKEGSGLGLAIVHQIVSDHGGYLRLTSNVPRGTVVSIELPVEFT